MKGLHQITITITISGIRCGALGEFARGCEVNDESDYNSNY